MSDTCPECGGPMYHGLLARECLARCSEGPPRWLQEVWPYIEPTELYLEDGKLMGPGQSDTYTHRSPKAIVCAWIEGREVTDVCVKPTEGVLLWAHRLPSGPRHA